MTASSESGLEPARRALSRYRVNDLSFRVDERDFDVALLLVSRERQTETVIPAGNAR
jgi:hypothetical protein